MKIKHTVRRGPRRAFTLIEMVTAMAVGVIVVMVCGAALVDAQSSWNENYDRAYGQMKIDAEVSQRIFESTVRRATLERCFLSNDRQMLEVYYSDSGTGSPDRFSRFYIYHGKFWVVHGRLWPGTYFPIRLDRVVLLAENAESVSFAIQGVSIQMQLSMRDGSRTRSILCTAIRYTN